MAIKTTWVDRSMEQEKKSIEWNQKETPIWHVVKIVFQIAGDTMDYVFKKLSNSVVIWKTKLL